MKFGLFLVLNVLVLIRPEELFPAITGLRLYLVVISLCTLVALPELLETLSLDSLRCRPISVCILLYFASTIVSLCVLGRVSEALFDFGPEFAKVILFYFLLITIVKGEEQFRIYILALLVCISVLTIIALLQHYGYTSFPNIEPAMQREHDPETGEEYYIPRLVSSGIFNDPNDLCLVLGLGILCCIYLTATGSLPFILSILWLLPVPLFGYAILETHSKGGVLGVLAGLAGYIYSRFGGPKSVPFAAAGAVACLALIGGRQGNMSGGGTAHERLMMWADGLENLFRQPLYLPTGLGLGWFENENGLVAHNSFVQAYIEQGIFGGGAFLGAFLLAGSMSLRLGKTLPAPGWTIRARHFGFAVVCAYGIGCYSVTRNTVIPTYLIIGLATLLSEPSAELLPEKYQVTKWWFRRGTLFSFAGLVGIKYATQLLGMAGV